MKTKIKLLIGGIGFSALLGYLLLKPKKKYYRVKGNFISNGYSFKSGDVFEGRTFKESDSVFLIVPLSTQFGSSFQSIEVPSKEVDLILGQIPNKS